MRIGSFLKNVFDALVPPRHTERLVRELSHTELAKLVLRGEKSGGLPYHDERVRALVWELKYYANQDAATLAGRVLSDVLVGVASESLGRPLLIPIPMHKKRRRQRRHNQTEVLCAAALHTLGDVRSQMFEYVPYIVERARATPQQQGLPKHEREKNLKGSMRATHPHIVRGRTCIVVDDVSTTGATFKEITRALRAAGASHVECIALAYS